LENVVVKISCNIVFFLKNVIVKIICNKKVVKDCMVLNVFPKVLLGKIRYLFLENVVVKIRCHIVFLENVVVSFLENVVVKIDCKKKSCKKNLVKDYMVVNVFPTLLN